MSEVAARLRGRRLSGAGTENSLIGFVRLAGVTVLSKGFPTGEAGTAYQDHRSDNTQGPDINESKKALTPDHRNRGHSFVPANYDLPRAKVSPTCTQVR
jgi:hypothetical protein